MAVREIVRNARKNDGIPKTAQQSIPFDRMFPDGICRVGLDYYTKTVQFQDINYQLAQQEDKTEIFEEWCAFLNFFDSSVKFQLSFENMATDVSDFEKSIKISHKKDGFDDVRDEYSEVLLHQMEAGNNGLTKTKYLTFGIHAESMKTAKPRLTHIETDILNNFKRLGVQARSLNGSERLEMMHRQFHMGDDAKFRFDWKYLTGSGLSVKDFIAPSSFAFPTGRYFQIGEMYGCMSFLSIDASDISDRLLADFLSMESSQIVTMHIQSVDQNEAIKTIKHTITELDRSKIEEQKKAVRAGYDMDIIPSDLATYGKDAKALLKELQSQNERMFLLTFLVMNTGKTKQELENNVFQAASIAQKHNCNLIRLDYQQEQGLMSTLPLANNLIEIQRGMTTSSTAIFVPFTTQELFQRGDEALYYGLNALSNNMIMVDRKKLKNPNALILGTPGSGKSFSAKREIANSFLVTDDDIIISDPESEYSPLVARFGGQVIKISPTSDQYINPMERAGADEMPEEVERKGIGTSATRAATIEKLVRIGFVERKGNKKTKYLLPTHKGVALITVMPEQIQSPSMTAEWEQKLLDVEKGEFRDTEFMNEIEGMITELVRTYKIIEDAEVLMHPVLEEIGTCPCCGRHVVERQKGYSCENRQCNFVLWKQNRFFEALGKKMTKPIAVKLLSDGKVALKGCKSKKTGKTYDTTVIMTVDENQRAVFELNFEKGADKYGKSKNKKD